MTFTFFKLKSTGNYVLETLYDEAFVAELKATLEPWERQWDPGMRVWKIDKEAFRRAAEVCRRYGDVHFAGDDPREEDRKRKAKEEAERLHQERERIHQENMRWQQAQRERREREERERQQQQRQQRQQSYDWAGYGFGARRSDHYQVLHLTSDAPTPVVRAVYRALALLHHPDKGGDTERMKSINVAFEAILRQRGEK